MQQYNIDTIINYIIEHKDIFIIALSLLTFIFSIFSFLLNNKNNKLKENLSNSKLLLENFYSPILNNHKLNKSQLIDIDICNFIYKYSFLLDDLTKILAFEIINLETNLANTLNSKVLKSKYEKTRKYFTNIILLYSKDLSRIYKFESFSISNKYLYPFKFRFIFNLLDILGITSLIFFIILIIFVYNLNISKLISFFIALGIIWLYFRFYILSHAKNTEYIANKPIFSGFNIYFHYQYSKYDALYINIFTKQIYLVFKGLPIPKSLNVSNKERFSIYKTIFKIDNILFN